MVKKVFISYSRPNQRTALRVHRVLSDADHAAWIDVVNLLPGANWVLEIRRAIHSSDFIVVCFSKASMDRKGYFHSEIKIAIEVLAQIPEGRRCLIPLRLDNCVIPDSFSAVHCLDWKAGRAKMNLLAALEEGSTKITRRGKIGRGDRAISNLRLLRERTSFTYPFLLRNIRAGVPYVESSIRNMTVYQVRKCLDDLQASGLLTYALVLDDNIPTEVNTLILSQLDIKKLRRAVDLIEATDPPKITDWFDSFPVV